MNVSFYQKISIFLLLLFCIIVIDQYIKYLFVNGYEEHMGCISLILVYNKGVAFSMFSDFGENLKYLQIALITGLFIYFLYDREFINEHFIAMGFIIGGGISNIIDRFFHIGVVDFFYWHCGFDFAVFNTADVFINIGAFLMILSFVLSYFREKNAK